MTIPEQRKRAAKLLGYKLEQHRSKEPRYYTENGSIRKSNYTPDTNIQQAAELKERLRELGYNYQNGYESKKKEFWSLLFIRGENSHCVGDSKLSESAALVEAVSKIPSTESE